MSENSSVIYDDWETYEIERWKPERKFSAFGTDLNSAWPTVPVKSTRERARNTEQSYIVTFTTPSRPGEVISQEMSEKDWRAVGQRGRVKVKLNFWNKVIKVSPD